MEGPRSVFIEASSKCQLRCPLCDTPARKEKTGTLGWGTLRFADFRRFLDHHPYVHQIGLSTHGELFLNPELPGIMRYASKRRVELSGISNLNTLKPAVAEGLVRSGFARLTVSIDGTDQHVYEMYRRGGKLLRVLKNIRLINRFKDKYKSLLPTLTWLFVVFDHNEHQMEQARAMAAGLRMGFVVRFSWEPEAQVNDRQAVVRRRAFGVASRQEFAKKYKKAYFAPCLQVWKSPQINWDGKLLGCCMNQRISFGNVFRSGLRRCLASPSYRQWQDVIIGKRRLTPDSPCFGCEAYGSLARRIYQRRRGVSAYL
jgi:MoaA/NifB/PqqE/SkfB family radical SAM enzyme